MLDLDKIYRECAVNTVSAIMCDDPVREDYENGQDIVLENLISAHRNGEQEGIRQQKQVLKNQGLVVYKKPGTSIIAEFKEFTEQFAPPEESVLCDDGVVRKSRLNELKLVRDRLSKTYEEMSLAQVTSQGN